MDEENRLPVLQAFGATVQTGRQDPHQAAVPVVRFFPSAALVRIPAPLIPLDRPHRPGPDIVRIIIGRVFSFFQPGHEILHDLLQVQTAGFADAVQQCQGQAAVVRPGTCRQVERPVPAHARHRILRDLLPVLKLHRASQRVPGHHAEHTVFPDIPHPITHLSIQTLHRIHPFTVPMIPHAAFRQVAPQATSFRPAHSSRLYVSSWVISWYRSSHQASFHSGTFLITSSRAG